MKTKRQLQKMTADEVVDYLLTNYKWHKLKYSTKHPHKLSYLDTFEIAGFTITKDTFCFYDDDYNGGAVVTLYIKNIKTGEEDTVAKDKGEKLLCTLKKSHEKRELFQEKFRRRIRDAIPIVLGFTIPVILLLCCHYCSNRGQARKNNQQNAKIDSKNDGLQTCTVPYEKVAKLYNVAQQAKSVYNSIKTK